MSEDSKIEIYDWKPRVESFEQEYVKDGHVFARALVTSTVSWDGTISWRWEVKDNTHEKMKAWGTGCSELEEAKRCAHRALKLIGELAEIGTFIVEREVPTDNVDMAMTDDGLGGCVLCGRSDITCLHDASDVRLALLIAMRMGHHQPHNSP